jgi:uncharacterized phage-associated protein
MSKTYSALQIANAFLDRAEREGRSLTNMKLQKLLYFAQGHSHALRGQKLMHDDPEAWQYGPVYHTVWEQFRRFGARAIDCKAIDEVSFAFSDADEPEEIPPPADGDVNRFLDAVWDAYKTKSAITLSEMSHVAGGPWAKARARSHRHSVIRDEEIAEYFKAARASAQARRAHAPA